MKPDGDVEVPITPYEVSSNVDFQHPSERCREPRITDNRPEVVRARQRRVPAVVDLEKKSGPRGLAHKIRRLRWPELFHNSRYPVALIEELARDSPAPKETQIWIDEVLASGGRTAESEKKYVVCRHPGFNRDALFELVSNPKHGPVYRCVSIANTGGRPGYLPPDLDVPDKRWEHLRGDIGDHRHFTKRDFEIIRESADRDRMNKVQIEAKVTQAQKDAYNEANRVENDFVADMLDYNFLAINTAANRGVKQYSVASVAVKENPEKYYIEERNGYRVRCKKDSRIAQELAAEAGSEERRRDQFIEKMEKLRREQERADLIRRANALTRRTAIPIGRKTL